MPEGQKIQWRRGTAAQWTAANPVLSDGTPGFETDTGKFKVGDGVKDWKTLSYQGEVTLAGTQTLTGKTMDGSKNTFTKIPAVATPDAARVVCTTATGGVTAVDGVNTWAKVLSWSVNSKAVGLGLTLGFSASSVESGYQSGILAVGFKVDQVWSQPPTVSVDILAVTAGQILGADAFKVISSAGPNAAGDVTTFELWVKKNQNYCNVRLWELSRSWGSSILPVYHDGAVWQAAEPVGAALNVRSGGVTVGGVPVVTTTAAQALSHKTLDTPTINTPTITLPRINAIHDTVSTARVLWFNPAGANPVNYFEMRNAPAGIGPELRVNGPGAAIDIKVRAKGSGRVMVGSEGASSTPTLVADNGTMTASLNLVSVGSGTVQANGNPVGVKVAVPASATAPGKPGEFAADATNFYVCTAPNTWVRGSLATW